VQGSGLNPKHGKKGKEQNKMLLFFIHHGRDQIQGLLNAKQV
jgi:hypothetical protein